MTRYGRIVTHRLRALQAATSKPTVLEEVRYPAWDQDSEARQAESLHDVLALAEDGETEGWLIWTAFDFAPPGQMPNQEQYFGLWRTDLTPKAALAVLPLPAQP